ncbi:MAG TPA: IS110 family transposase [Propionibacteriaceae bacterium]|nr:IS110 family transposase [Propionibacteriaceae bacterium]
MVVVGADVHKRTHTFVAVNEVGQQLGELRVSADGKGHAKALRWARQQFPGERRWGIEDCRHLSARLERDLLTGGESVVRVPPKLMAQTRASARTRGKSDPIDALAVARAVLREPDLPVAAHDELSRELKLLVDRREDLVGERTRMINRLRWHLHELDPSVDPSPTSLNRAKTRAELSEQLARYDGLVAELARDILADIDRITQVINALQSRISHRVEEQAAGLIGLPGCGALTAAKIMGETAGIDRFRSEACYARHAGVAPIPVWSGNTAGRVRMSRAGNRQLNCALHRIAVTQTHLDGEGRRYYRKRLLAGDSKTEALRCLKRRLARVVFQTLKSNVQPDASFQPAVA